MLLIFDTETTGLPTKDPLGHPNQPRLVQLGAVLVEPDQTERMRLDVVIYRDEIPEVAVRAHGITAEFAKRFGVNEGSALQVFEDMMEVADVIIAHNLDFDKKIITNAFRLMYGGTADPFEGKNQFCTMRAATPVCKLPRRGDGGWKQPTLTEAHMHFFGEGFGGAHQAINDVLACQRVYFKLMELVSR